MDPIWKVTGVPLDSIAGNKITVYMSARADIPDGLLAMKARVHPNSLVKTRMVPSRQEDVDRIQQELATLHMLLNESIVGYLPDQTAVSILKVSDRENLYFSRIQELEEQLSRMIVI